MTNATHTRTRGLKSYEQIERQSRKVTTFCIQNEANLQRKFKDIDKQFVKSK